MKPGIVYHKLLLAFFTGVITLTSHAQQEFTFTTSSANITSAQAVINLPQLNGNPHAIILAIPQGNTKALNSNPVGVWYYSGKWYVFNSNFAPMLIGLTYKIQYFLNEGPNEFLHLVTQANLAAGVSYIDHPALNDKPAAQFNIMQNHSPDIRAGSWRNPHEAKAAYNITTGRWYLANKNTQPLQKGCAYNIVVTGTSTTTPVTTANPTNPANPTSVGTCNCPASLPPNGQASGDLAGMYPNPMVSKILNRPLSNTAPTIGQVLKWNGTEWIPSDESQGNIGTGNNYTAGLGLTLNGNEFSAAASAPIWNASKILGRDIVTTAPAVGQVLKWAGGSWVPANDSVGISNNNNSQGPNPLFNNTYQFGLTSFVLTTGVGTQYELPGLDQNITLTQTCKVLVAIHVAANNEGCFGCSEGTIDFRLFIDNAAAALDKNSIAYFQYKSVKIANGFSVNEDSGFRMITLGPGTHNFKMVANHGVGGNIRVYKDGEAYGTRMMIIAIPQ